ncbi:MAG: hypothetical protein ACWGQW_01210 [bacterium]
MVNNTDLPSSQLEVLNKRLYSRLVESRGLTLEEARGAMQKHTLRVQNMMLDYQTKVRELSSLLEKDLDELAEKKRASS